MKFYESLIKMIGGYIAVWLAITSAFFVGAWTTSILFDMDWKETTHNAGFVVFFIGAHIVGMVVGLLIPMINWINEN